MSSPYNFDDWNAMHIAYGEADDAIKLLHGRFKKDWQSLRSTNDGWQTVKDFQELVTKGIEALCNRAGIPAFKTAHLFQQRIAKEWLDEVALKQLLFFLLLMGKGLEVFTMQGSIEARFGEMHAAQVVEAALFLSEQFRRAAAQQDIDHITAIFQETFVASPKLDEYRRFFI